MKNLDKASWPWLGAMSAIRPITSIPGSLSPVIRHPGGHHKPQRQHQDRSLGIPFPFDACAFLLSWRWLVLLLADAIIMSRTSKEGSRPRVRGPTSASRWDGMPLGLRGSARRPVTAPVFKTGGRRVPPSPMGSTPIRFRHFKPAGLLEILAFVASAPTGCDRLAIS